MSKEIYKDKPINCEKDDLLEFNNIAKILSDKIFMMLDESSNDGTVKLLER